MWYKRAAEQRISHSQYVLGILNLNGEGVDFNKREGLKWMKRAAKNGNPQVIMIHKGYFNKVKGDNLSIISHIFFSVSHLIL